MNDADQRVAQAFRDGYQHAQAEEEADRPLPIPGLYRHLFPALTERQSPIPDARKSGGMVQPARPEGGAA